MKAIINFFKIISGLDECERLKAGIVQLEIELTLIIKDREDLLDDRI